MKKQIVSFALSAVFGLGVALAAPQSQDQAAQPETNTQATHEHHRMDPNRQVQRLTKRLNLTADQQKQILPVLADQQQQMQAIWKDSSLSATDRREKMQTVRQDSEAKIKAVLNDTQKQEWDQMVQQRRDRAQQWREKHANADKGTSSKTE